MDINSYTLKQVIKMLKKYPEDTEVYIRGYNHYPPVSSKMEFVLMFNYRKKSKKKIKIKKLELA